MCLRYWFRSIPMVRHVCRVKSARTPSCVLSHYGKQNNFSNTTNTWIRLKLNSQYQNLGERNNSFLFIYRKEEFEKHAFHLSDLLSISKDFLQDSQWRKPHSMLRKNWTYLYISGDIAGSEGTETAAKLKCQLIVIKS